MQQWLDAHPLRYDTGEEVQPGDSVDFGFDGKFSNGPSIDVADVPWLGEVVRRDGLKVIVDTHLNSYRGFEPSELTFMGRRQAMREYK